MAGSPAELRFHIGKNDFWGIRTQSPMAVGQVQIWAPALQGASFHAEQDMAMAEVRGAFAKDGTALITRAWVDANANRLFIELANQGDQPLVLGVQTIQGVSGASAPIAATRSAETALLYDPDNRPEGRKVAVCTRLLGSKLEDSKFTLPPGGKVLVATIILSDLDAKDPLAEAKTQMQALTLEKAAEMATQHRQWWQNYWGRSFIEIPDKVLEQHWYAAQYIMGSCSRAGKVAPGLWGNWITTDQPAWHGDFHLNYNFQAPFYGVYAANHADVSLPFYQAINEFVPRGKQIAERKAWQGVHFPVSIGPWGMCPEGEDCDWGQRSDAAYCALNFIWYYQYTQDKEWLKNSGYNFLREVAIFWESYLKLEQGRYVIYNDSIHEGSGPDMNGILSLGLVRTLFKNMLVMSRDLGVDESRRAKWLDICEKISAFPTQKRDGNTVFRYSEKGAAWFDDNTLGIHHIYPAGAIGLDSDPTLLEISRNMADAMARWDDNNGSSSWYTFCARIGYDPKTILTHMRQMTDRASMPNKLLSFGGGGIENAAAFHGITEMPLQSHVNVILLFPGWPQDQDARFGGLRTVGAFLVSAELNSGVVSGVKIASEKGMDCTVVNPWPGKRVQIIRNGKSAEIMSGERLTFATAQRENLMLTAKN